MFLAELLDSLLIFRLHQLIDLADLLLVLVSVDLDLPELPLMLGDGRTDLLDLLVEVVDALLELALGATRQLDLLLDLSEVALSLLLTPLVLVLGGEGLLPLCGKLGDRHLHLA